jgi:hypothetical protein
LAPSPGHTAPSSAFDHVSMAAPFVVSGVLTLGAVGLIRGIAAPTASLKTGPSPTFRVGVAPADAARQTLPAVD